MPGAPLLGLPHRHQGGDLSAGAAVALFLLPILLAISIVVLRYAYRSEDA
ncbi:MAG: hypothetical protein P8Y02_13700 [Deinococcales bacterium]